jgi:hypothetical protein
VRGSEGLECRWQARGDSSSTQERTWPDVMSVWTQLAKQVPYSQASVQWVPVRPWALGSLRVPSAHIISLSWSEPLMVHRCKFGYLARCWLKQKTLFLIYCDGWPNGSTDAEPA